MESFPVRSRIRRPVHRLGSGRQKLVDAAAVHVEDLETPAAHDDGIAFLGQATHGGQHHAGRAEHGARLVVRLLPLQAGNGVGHHAATGFSFARKRWLRLIIDLKHHGQIERDGQDRCFRSNPGNPIAGDRVGHFFQELFDILCLPQTYVGASPKLTRFYKL